MGKALDLKLMTLNTTATHSRRVRRWEEEEGEAQIRVTGSRDSSVFHLSILPETKHSGNTKASNAVGHNVNLSSQHDIQRGIRGFQAEV